MTGIRSTRYQSSSGHGLVLQGAPVTGKTHLAKLMAERLGVTEDHSVFTQFHAETSYSDFVWGIRPRLGRDDVAYEKTEGPLHRAICLARDHPQSPVLLIIDEINRANLATVLGPVFYLFEYQMAACGTVSLEVGPGLFVDRLLDLVQRS